MHGRSMVVGERELQGLAVVHPSIIHFRDERKVSWVFLEGFQVRVIHGQQTASPSMLRHLADYDTTFLTLL
jgi:hypothetical protein